MAVNWRLKFEEIAQRYRLKVVGLGDVYNEAQAETVLALLAIYGDAAVGVIYIEPTLAHSSQRPPDIVLLHKAVGVLVIEVKGYSLSAIHSLDGGNFLVHRNGKLKEENPIRQAQQTVFDLRNALQRMGLHPSALPLLNSLAAFPRISEGDWNAEGYEGVLPREDVLFQEDIESPKRLKHWIEKRIQYALDKTGKSDAMNPTQFNQVMAIFGRSTVVNPPSAKREAAQAETLGAEVAQLYSLDKALSKEQQEFSRVEIRGRQRLFRGVAGSGKSVILANQVARLLTRHQGQDLFGDEPPPLRVAVICFNRTLVPFLRQKIQAAYYEQTLEEKLPNDLFITHFNGLLYELSKHDKATKELNYISTYQMNDPQARAIAYREQLQTLQTERPQKYAALLLDAIFVDEGQDFLSEEYQVLMTLLRPDSTTEDKNLIIFYDDAQNVYANQRPNWKELGINIVGRSEVMKRCFRNPREIVELAFNVLLGMQSPPDMRVQTRTFADVDYLKQAQLVEELAEHFRILFTLRSDPQFMPQLYVFADRQAEKQWVAEEIRRLLQVERVRPEDILVVFHKTSPFQDLGDGLQAEDGIQGIIQTYHKDFKDHYLFKEGYLTLSTTHSAKGYDAPLVFVMGVDLFSLDNQGRASFYVGATRAKLRLYLTGIKTEQPTLLDESFAVRKLL